MKDLSATMCYLGITITWAYGSKVLNLGTYVEAELTNFNMMNCRPYVQGHVPED